MLRPETPKIKKFLAANREFKLARIVNKKIEVMLSGNNNYVYKTSDFSLNSKMRRALNELEKELGLPVV